MIQCPHCGNFIPENANYCVYCGCRIFSAPGFPVPLPEQTVCPECGSKVPPGLSVCPNCGMGLGSAPKPDETSKLGYPKAENFRKLWTNANASAKTTKKLLEWLSGGIFALAGILLVVGYIIFNGWKSDMGGPNALEALFHANEKLKTIDGLIIGACVAFFVSTALSTAERCYHKFCMCGWIRDKHLQPISVLERKNVEMFEKGTGFELQAKDGEKEIMSAFYWAEFPERQGAAIAAELFRMALWGLFILFLGLAAHENLQSFFASMILYGDASAYAVQYPYLIFAAVSLAAEIIVQWCHRVYCDKRLDDWVKSLRGKNRA